MAGCLLASVASAEESRGEVLSYSGDKGELIMSRDGIIYWLETGSQLVAEDILRSREAEKAVIVFDGCEFELPAGEDIYLDDDFCDAFAVLEPTAAEKASEGLANEVVAIESTVDLSMRTDAPLVVGGVILSVGGLAAAAGGDGGGAGSPTSNASGATSSNPNSS